MNQYVLQCSLACAAEMPRLASSTRPLLLTALPHDAPLPSPHQAPILPLITMADLTVEAVVSGACICAGAPGSCSALHLAAAQVQVPPRPCLCALVS